MQPCLQGRIQHVITRTCGVSSPCKRSVGPLFFGFAHVSSHDYNRWRLRVLEKAHDRQGRQADSQSQSQVIVEKEKAETSSAKAGGTCRAESFDDEIPKSIPHMQRLQGMAICCHVKRWLSMRPVRGNKESHCTSLLCKVERMSRATAGRKQWRDSMQGASCEDSSVAQG